MYIKVQPHSNYYYGPIKLYRIPKKQKKWYQRFESNWLRSVGRFTEKYLLSSCIHGFGYFVKKGLTLFEKCFWVLLVILSIYGCITIALQSITRFYSKNTVMSLERDLYFWQTSLPSVTMCPMKRLDQTLFDKYCSKRKIEGKDKTELQDFLESLANATYMNLDKIPRYDGVDMTLNTLNIKPQHYMSLIYNLTVDSATTSNESQRLISNGRTESLQIRQILTEFGLCYLTNSHLENEYSSKYLLFGKYPKINKKHVKVFRGSYFHNNMNYEFHGLRTWRAIATYVHNSFDAMKIDSTYDHLSQGIKYNVEINEISTEDDLEKKANVQQRKCRFPHESNLTHYPIYTKNLCIQECRLNMVYEKCECIPHFYPNRLDEPKPVCNYRVLKGCVYNHRDFFVKMYIRKKTVHSCNCLANCRDGLMTISESKLVKENVLLDTNYYVVNVEVISWPILRLKRQVIHNFTDLLVSIGGTAGLFLGFSVLGAVEFVYYFTLRFVCYLRGYVV